MTTNYADDIDRYEPVPERLGVTPLWLPSDQGLIIKNRSAGALSLHTETIAAPGF